MHSRMNCSCSIRSPTGQSIVTDAIGPLQNQPANHHLCVCVCVCLCVRGVNVRVSVCAGSYVKRRRQEGFHGLCHWIGPKRELATDPPPPPPHTMIAILATNRKKDRGIDIRLQGHKHKKTSGSLVSMYSITAACSHVHACVCVCVCLTTGVCNRPDRITLPQNLETPSKCIAGHHKARSRCGSPVLPFLKPA